MYNKGFSPTKSVQSFPIFFSSYYQLFFASVVKIESVINAGCPLQNLLFKVFLVCVVFLDHVLCLSTSGALDGHVRVTDRLALSGGGRNARI